MEARARPRTLHASAFLHCTRPPHHTRTADHLDAESVAWLEQFLKAYKGTVLAITHDRCVPRRRAGRELLLLGCGLLCPCRSTQPLSFRYASPPARAAAAACSYFLDNVAGWILEVDRGAVYPHLGNYRWVARG
jgi:energy-dependent translational throttle protein EttA